jgi:hypothetical protein
MLLDIRAIFLQVLEVSEAVLPENAKTIVYAAAQRTSTLSPSRARKMDSSQVHAAGQTFTAGNPRFFTSVDIGAIMFRLWGFP